MKKAPANAAIVLKLLQKYYPEAHCALNHKNAFELLIATILSAQCTDERVNIVTKDLFAKYPTPEKMAKASSEDLERLIRSAGFYKNKAKNIKACSLLLVEKFKGEVPSKMEDLIHLAGVGRKTANVVLGNAFGIASGIVVDTHVLRLSQRLGWVKGDNAVVAEKRLCEFVPKNHWIQLSHELISHGRLICKARKPQCERCFLNEHCPKKGVI
ncbi:MAG: endonuclease III [Pseudobdellovibrionaceae bacterium]